MSAPRHLPTTPYPRFHLAFPVTDLAARAASTASSWAAPKGAVRDDWVDFDFYGHQIVAHKVAPRR